MRHAFVDVGDKTMCSRCGNEATRIDEECLSMSDGAIYASVQPSCGCVFCDLGIETVEENGARNHILRSANRESFEMPRRIICQLQAN